MVLKQIELLNFRLHRKTSIEFSDKLNLIVGGNGQGKTTILEAIYYLCTTKNLHLSSENEVVTYDEQYFEIAGKFIDLTEDKVRLNYDIQKNKKTYYLNEKQINSAAEIIGKFPVVSLTQSDHSITQGAPADRRKFVDSIISQVSQSYLKILLEYSKILKQRSIILNQIRENKNINLYSQLDVWTEALITRGTEIIKHRKNFIVDFDNYLKEAYKQIMTDEEIPAVVYSTQINNEEKIENEFRESLENQKEEEIRKSMNLIGPHRDDYIFYLNGKELKRYGSQGQHKTFQIALRFAQFFYIQEKISKSPIFLMDDIFGELDKYRAGKISSYLPKVGQAFITMTDLTKKEELGELKDSLFIKVENGKTTIIN